MKLKIYVGKSNLSPVATCEKEELLDTLRDIEVVDSIRQSVSVVRVLSADGDELASVWYDEATAHEEGMDWDSLSESLAEKVA